MDKGVIARLFRYPVKSMRGEEPTHARVTSRGMEADRLWALVDRQTGRIVSAKHPRKWSRMLELRARVDDGSGTALVTFPGGETVSFRDPDIDEKLSDFLGRAVHLTDVAPDGPAIERADPIVDGTFIPEGKREVVTRRLSSPPGTFFDYAPLHFVTTATLARLHELAPESRFDAARFRPNLLVDIPDQPPFAENGWIGGRLVIGADTVLEIDLPVPRCAVPTLAQGDLPRDQEVIRTIARHNRVTIAGDGTHACLGAYARVLQGGEIRAGDTVRLEHP